MVRHQNKHGSDVKGLKITTDQLKLDSGNEPFQHFQTQRNSNPLGSLAESSQERQTDFPGLSFKILSIEQRVLIS